LAAGGRVRTRRSPGTCQCRGASAAHRLAWERSPLRRSVWS